MQNPMEQQVSTKNTKNEILKAYEELLKKVQQQKPEDAKTKAEQKEKQKIVEKASSQSYEGIVKNIADLKINLNNSLDDLEDSLLNEFKKFTEVKEALDTESKRLEEVYQVSVNADSLAALLLAQKEKKEQFEKEMAEKKAAFELEMNENRESWQVEKQKLEQSYKERKEEVEKQRKREEEEYNYNLKQKRKKEEDEYHQKKQALDREIAEKQKEWTEKEAEYQQLKKQVEGFPKEMEDAVKKAKDEVTKELTTKHAFEKDLFQKETEGEIKLYKQTIQNVESKIKEQNALIEQLTKKSDYSSDQVKEIAVKAIEGASNQRFILRDREKGEQEKEK